MKIKSLIVEDDFAARRLMQIYLDPHGECSIAINGIEAINAIKHGIKENAPYDLVCLDIMMPQMDGMETLENIRKIEEENGIQGLDQVKVIMTTAKSLSKDIFAAFKTGCEAYLIKPIKKSDLLDQMEKLGLSVKVC